MPSVVMQKNKKGETRAVGSAIVMKTQGSKLLYVDDEQGKRVMFSGIVEQSLTGGFTEHGRRMYDSTVVTFTAYGARAEYCRQALKPGSTFFFTARVTKNHYWTERNGKESYTFNMDFCMAEPKPDRDYKEEEEREEEKDVDMIYGDPDF
jgi:L,D-peptidoglycan transpeptidase YkuD (ErfK/YbiS/YcfS/YnhG family)